MLQGQGGLLSEAARKLRADLMATSPYEILGLLGEGGMGEVFDAQHRMLGHRVVVKVLRESYTDRFDLYDRMRVEGQALARIRHPNLVLVTDFGQTRAGRPFLVMERLIGRSLREELILRGALPVAEAAEIARQMLHGLAIAHEAGLVHRDVKPDNVFLCATEDGRPFVKVLDFGVVKIVKIAQAERDPRTPAPLASPTADGVTLGTPRYFSPEQARGDRELVLDARSDVYAVGLVLYLMVAGRGPFDHRSSLEDVFRAHMIEAPKPPSEVAPQAIPPALERIVLCALQKDREERFPDAIAFAGELARFLGELGDEGRRYGGVLPLLVGTPGERGLAEATTFPLVPAGSATSLAVVEVPAAEKAPEPGAAPNMQATRPEPRAAAGVSPIQPAMPAPPGVPAAASMQATATASPAVEGGARDLRSTSRRLSGEAVVLEGVVERVLSNPPGHVREKLSRSGNIDRTVIDAVPAPSSRGSVPETAPMFEVAASSRPGPAAPASAPVANVPVPTSAPLPPSMPVAASAPLPPSTPVAPVAAVPVRAPLPGSMPVAAPLAGSSEAQPGFTVPLPTLRRPPSRAGWKVPVLISVALIVLAALVVFLVYRSS